MNPVHVVVAGVALIIAGLAWWLGPAPLIAAGVLLVLVGLLVDEEALRGKPDKPPRR